MKYRIIAISVLIVLISFPALSQNSVPVQGIINLYTPVLSLLPCENKILTENATGFQAGDTVLLIQMKGADIDSSNTDSFGSISQYNGAGHYEINYVKNISGNIVELKNIITRTYNIPAGKVQLIRVPYYQNVTVAATLTCLPWDGDKGGVLVLHAADSIQLGADIDLSGRGFRGGVGFNSQATRLNCNENQFYYPQSSIDIAGQKGESIAVLSSDRNYGKGGPANAGGGGLGHNSGGGGGANAGEGGFGGYQLNHCGGAPFDNRGAGGKSLTNSSLVNRLFLGGGGGAGQADNAGNPPPHGGNGGGIVIIIGNKLKSNNFKIIANGSNASTCSIPPAVDCHDAMGGGGAGGTIVLDINQYLDNTRAEHKGGNGSDMVGSVPLGGRIGPGGGGGGGALFIKGPTVPAPVISVATGGINGVLTQDGNIAWGTTPGQNGAVYTAFNLTIDNIPFKPNIDSVRIRDLLLTCNDYDFRGSGFTNTHPVASWEWSFGDGGSASTQNVTYSYTSTGPYTVKLIVTDINGCKDSVSKLVNPSFLSMDAGPSDTICITGSTRLQSSATGAVSYAWSPAAFLNDPSILNPVATPPVTTQFYLTATNAAGCTLRDSVKIEVRSFSGFSISPSAEICPGRTAFLTVSGGDLFTWSPAGSLNDPVAPNPVASPAQTTLYSVYVQDTLCGFSNTLNTTVTVRNPPPVRALRSNDVDCANTQSRLSATGALSYLWTPAATLSNPAISNPIATPLSSTQYSVTGTDGFGCTNTDSVLVKALGQVNLQYQMPTAFTPNNDGLNDCYGIRYWGQIFELEFSIYTRWGERVFFTRDPGACWDGTVRGMQQNPGVFVFMIRARTSCQDFVFRKGTFALIR